MSAFDNQIGGGHYKALKIQPAEYCFANNIGHLAGDAIAYITRYKSKNGMEDLKKAIHSLQLLMELEENERKTKPGNGDIIQGVVSATPHPTYGKGT